MKYTAEQIKPKKYPDEKPSEQVRLFHAYNLCVGWGVYRWFGRTWGYKDSGISSPNINHNNTWFIDIPGAPPELKPLAYPDNKPDERGSYLCHIDYDAIHDIEHDSWDIMKWCWDDYNKKNDWNGYRALVDYFIPYRLDKENEMDVIWETDELKVLTYAGGSRVSLKQNTQHINPHVIGCSKDELTAFARHWLDLQGYEVTRKEPEIKACPNPTCELTEHLEVVKMEWGTRGKSSWFVHCKNCGYRGGCGHDRAQAIEIHNLIVDNVLPRKGE